MNPKTRQNIGANIKKIREKRELSQGELARSIGKQTATYIAFIEKGERNITTADLMAIAKRLGVTVSTLIGERERKKIPFKEALRASDDLTREEREKMEDYYKFVKRQKNAKRL